jgi:hypothetical protein
MTPFMAEPTHISARTVKIDNWILLYLNPSQNISNISRSGLFQAGAAVGCAIPGS